VSACRFWAGLGWGLIAAAEAAAGLAIFVTVWEVIENPGGIFRGEGELRYEFVAETAASWFLPTLPAIAPIMVVVGVVAAYVRSRRG
jgi:hypothetical protein